MELALERSKAVVARFNKEVIEQGNIAGFRSLMDENFVNRAAPPGTVSGPPQISNWQGRSAASHFK